MYARRHRRTEQLQLQEALNDEESDVTNNVTVSYSSADVSGGDEVEQRPKHRLIRGSKKAVTITKRQYLKSDWCKTEPFQQIIQMVPSLFALSVFRNLKSRVPWGHFRRTFSKVVKV